MMKETSFIYPTKEHEQSLLTTVLSSRTGGLDEDEVDCMDADVDENDALPGGFTRKVGSMATYTGGTGMSYQEQHVVAKAKPPPAHRSALFKKYR